MADDHPSIPLNRSEVIDEYFLDHRAKLIDIAAFLDRVERAGGDCNDFRIKAMHEAIAQLGTPGADRARRVQMAFSDLTDEPIDAAPMKGALGAYDPGEAG